MEGIQRDLSDKDKIAIAVIYLDEILVRLFLLVAAAMGSVSLALYTTIYSSMDVPRTVFVLERAFYIPFGTFYLSVMGASFFYLHGKYYGWGVRGLGQDTGPERITTPDLKKGGKKVAIILLGLALSPFFAQLGSKYIIAPSAMPKPMTCAAVHHTLALNPNYPLSYKVKALNCPDLTLPPEKRDSEQQKTNKESFTSKGH